MIYYIKLNKEECLMEKGEKKYTLWLTEEQHQQIKLNATIKGVSMKEYILNLVQKDRKEKHGK